MFSLTVKSNGYSLSTTQNNLGKIEALSANLSAEELQKAYFKHGYLLLKSVIEEKLFDAFHQDFEHFYVSGRSKGMCLQKATKLDTYNAIIEHPKLKRIVEQILNSPVALLERKIIRRKPAFDSSKDTGAHYDMTYLRCGGKQLVTCWIPLVNISLESGGLTYLENSHKIGEDLENSFHNSISNFPNKKQQEVLRRGMAGKGWITKDLPSLARKYSSKWLISDYQIGDILIHSPYIIHASISNCNTNLCDRLSTDIRYQSTESRIDPRWRQAWEIQDGL